MEFGIAAIEVDFLLEDSAKILDSMKMGTQRVRDIIVSLRNFSRLDEATIKDVDLCEGIDSTLLILNHRIKQGVKVITDYGSLPLVTCSPAQLNQVFTNIIANALDAMFEADVTPKELTITTRLLNDEQVQISIRDSGPGMPEAVKARIFDPFFTTKAIGKGTGIGLGICFKIIQQHQGTIVVNSEVGKGTEFLITLPKTAQIVPLEDPSESADTEGPKTAVA
ncbi:MAG: ATP-binding protein [Cyanobacteria bacterium J06560_5]